MKEEKPYSKLNSIKNEKVKPKLQPEKSSHSIFPAKATFGEKASDSLTRWAGSWLFIFSFLIIIFIWISLNIYGWIQQWDPYPFILLNLALSLLAALQAPVILMSQNRQSQKDRIRAEYDYSTNRKSAREIDQLKKQISRIERKLR